MLDVDGEAKVFPVGRAVEVTRGLELKKISVSPLQDLRKHSGLLTVPLTVARVLCSLGNRLTLSLSHRQMRTCTHLLSHINYTAKTPLSFIEIWASHTGAVSERCAYNILSEGAFVCWVSWKPSPLKNKK